MDKIFQWNEIKDKYTDSILLGNGASIAVDEKFNYTSLYISAKDENLIDKGLSTLFENFKTTDFESIMHKLLQASVVNQALSIDNNAIQFAYEKCRTTLIDILQLVHPKYDDINVDHLDKVASFLRTFKKVITLNYDLILYWSIYRGNLTIYGDDGQPIEQGNLFKDGFIERSNGDKSFKHDWAFLEEPHGSRKKSVLIFYLHGNLSLANMIKDQIYEIDVKITSPDDNHLDAIFKKWKTGNYTPLFVCDGEAKRKLASINNNNYLSIVYYDVLKRIGDSIAIYGFNFNEQDDHVVLRLGEISRKYPINNMAISVFRDGTEISYMEKVKKIVNDKIGRNIKIEFFDSKSQNCWNN